MLWTALVCALAVANPPLEEDIDFQEGKRLVDELDYERAVFRFQKLTKTDRSAEERATAYAWLGLTYANLGDEGEAIKAFVAAIKLDALVVLPPSSPKVAQTFDKARKQVREEVKADSDGDGLADATDKCPNEPETKNGFNDDDGCADSVPVVAAVDSDGDGVVDADDACKTVAGTAAEHGCPPQVPPPASGAPVFLIGGGAATGLGVVAIGLGAGLGFAADARQGKAVAALFQDERQALKAEADGLATGANVAYVAGGALVVVGGGLLLVSLMGGDG